MLKKINFFLVSICIVGFISQLSISMYAPALPEMINSLSISRSQSQMIMTYYLIGYALFQLIFGGLSDKLGRRHCFVLGACMASVGTLLMMFHSIHLIEIGRFIQGAGFGVTGVVSKAALRDQYAGQEYAKKVSYLLMIIFIAPALSPMLGAFIANQYGWESIFMILFLAIFSLLILLFFFYPETNIEPDRKSKNTLTLLINILQKNPSFWLYSCVSGSVYAADICFDLTGAFILRTHYKLSLNYTGISFIVPIIGMIVGTIVVNKSKQNLYLLQKRSLFSMVLISLILVASDQFWSTSLILFLAGLFLFMIFCGVLYSTLAASALEPFTQCAGMAASIFGTLHFLIAGISSIFVALFSPTVGNFFFYILIISSICACLGWLIKYFPQDLYNAQRT